MPITPSNESQNSAALTNEPKTGSTVTWDEAFTTWDEATGTWDNPGTPARKESQNSTPLTNESQN